LRGLMGNRAKPRRGVVDRTIVGRHLSLMLRN
jgi:hypothetical protein